MKLLAEMCVGALDQSWLPKMQEISYSGFFLAGEAKGLSDRGTFRTPLNRMSCVQDATPDRTLCTRRTFSSRL